MMPRFILIQFTRDCHFPRFSMEAGECWTLGTTGSRASYLADDDFFDFAGGQCRRTAVRELYRGDDRNQLAEIEEAAVMAGPDTSQRRAHERLAVCK